MEEPSSSDNSSLQSSRPGYSGTGLIRKKQRMDGERICRVCGDKAVAHNFDVISCESCKTFFRRNAHKPQKECAFGGGCEITVNTRRFCTVCRLNKCVRIGMRADMILDEAERKARMDKITENRKKRQMEAAKNTTQTTNTHISSGHSSQEQPKTQSVTSRNSSGSVSVSSGSSPLEFCSSGLDPPLADSNVLVNQTPTQQAVGSPDPVDLFTDFLAEDQIDSYSRLENAVREAQCGGGQVSESPCVPSTNGSNTHSNPHNAGRDEGRPSSSGADKRCRDSCCQTLPPGSTVHRAGRRAANFQHIPEALLPSDPSMYWHLTQEEQSLLNTLTEGYKEMVLHVSAARSALELRFEDLCLNEALSYGERCTVDLVKFIKTVPDFTALQMRDQLAALKASAMRCHLVAAAARFSVERNSWVKEYGEMPVSVYARVLQQEELTSRYADFCRSLKRILREDHTAFMLLTLVILFEPGAANMLDRQTVNRMHDKYGILLKHHLESQYSYVFASEYTEAVWDSLDENRELVADMEPVFVTWRDKVGPLQAEVMFK